MTEPAGEQGFDATVSVPRLERTLGIALAQFALLVVTLLGWLELSKGHGGVQWFLLPFASTAALVWLSARRETHENARLQIDAQGVRIGDRNVLGGRRNEAAFVLEHDDETLLVVFDQDGSLKLSARFARVSASERALRLDALRPFLQGDRGVVHVTFHGATRALCWGDLGLRVNRRLGGGLIPWREVDETRVGPNGVRIDFLFDSMTFSVNAVPKPFQRALHEQLAERLCLRSREGPKRALARASVRALIARNGRSEEEWHDALRELARSERGRDPYRSTEGLSASVVEAIADDPSESDDAREGAAMTLELLRHSPVTGVRASTEGAEAHSPEESEHVSDERAARGRDG